VISQETILNLLAIIS